MALPLPDNRPGDSWEGSYVVLPVGKRVTSVRPLPPVPPRRPRARRRRVGLILASLAAFIVLAAVVALASAWNYATRPLPPVDQVSTGDMFQTAMIYDRGGHLLSEMVDPNGGKRTVVSLSQMPRNLIVATVDTEDPTFYQNPGVDPRAIARAVLQDLRHGGVVSGASTITQQLVRNVVMTPSERESKSLSRKIGEAILALRVSARYSKDEILQRYLNEIYYGNLAYGVEAASETYFDKPVGQLDLAEAALIAGLPQAPSHDNPYQHPRAAKARQREVLNAMVKHGAITRQQADAAAAEVLHFRSVPRPNAAPHFTNYVREILVQDYSRQEIYARGLRVYTSLDLNLQQRTEAIVRAHLGTLRQNGASDAAVVVLDARTGAILAYVGSPNYDDQSIRGEIDLARAPREAGSALLPFLYLEAFDQGILSPASTLDDVPVHYPMGSGNAEWSPKDDDGQYRGKVTARRALATSLNVPAVELLRRVGVDPYLSWLRRFGISTLDHPASYYGLSLALGTGSVRLLDLTAAYAVLANGGVRATETPAPLLRVTDASGKVVAADTAAAGQRIASAQATWLIDDILASDPARAERFGAHSTMELKDRPAAVKGTTTASLRDSWAIGYTPRVVVGVWVGNADGTRMYRAFGLSGSVAIWHDVIEAALQGQPAVPFQRPPGLVPANVNGTTDWTISGAR